MDDINFENVMEIFSTGIPPEVSHFRNKVHPGRHWWLKTVIPIDNTLESARVWRKIRKKEPLNIHITDSAYDWFGNPIDACSVWIREGIDVILTVGYYGNIDYEIKKFAESFNDSGKWLHEQITNAWESNTQNINDED